MIREVYELNKGPKLVDDIGLGWMTKEGEGVAENVKLDCKVIVFIYRVWMFLMEGNFLEFYN